MTTATTLDARGEELAVVQAPLEPRVQRIDDDAERDGPEDRLHETADQPEERQRDGEQQGDEKRSFDVALGIIGAPVG